MKKRCPIAILFCLLFFSCKKNEDIKKTFEGSLPIVSTSTPPTAVIGQDIISQVRCELSSMSGSVYFQGFEIKEVSTRQYHLTAKALYKDWSTQIGLPVMWTLDTSSNILATSSGQFILKFYNDAKLVKADTVVVN